MDRFIIFDTETTALIPNSVANDDLQPEVFEFYGKIIDDEGVKLDELHFLCLPRKPLSEEITKITGYKNEDLVGSLPFAHYVPALRRLVSGATAAVAHNINYDLSVLRLEIDRLRLPPIEWPERKICTVEHSEWYKGFRLNLGALHEHLFGEPFANAHKAQNDVDALARCFIAMLKRGDI